MLSSWTSWLDKHGRDGAALVLRLGFSFFLAANHGLPKLLKFADKHLTFADPLGVSPTVSMALAIFGELVCPILVAVGLLTRLAALPALITMFVAGVLVHDEDILGKGEPALVFGLGYLAILLLGGGRFSLDALVRRRRGGA